MGWLSVPQGKDSLDSGYGSDSCSGLQEHSSDIAIGKKGPGSPSMSQSWGLCCLRILPSGTAAESGIVMRSPSLFRSLFLALKVDQLELGQTLCSHAHGDDERSCSCLYARAPCTEELEQAWACLGRYQLSAQERSTGPSRVRAGASSFLVPRLASLQARG